MYVEGVWLLVRSPQFATKVFVICPKAELICISGVVAETVVDVVVRDAGASAERNLAAEVGKEVEAVVVMVFRDGQITVQYEPMDEVRQLAHAAANAL